MSGTATPPPWRRRRRTGRRDGPAGPAGWIEADVADPDSVERAFRETRARAGGSDGGGAIDILVNNAGISGPNMPTWEYAVDDWRRVIDIDLTGPYLVRAGRSCRRCATPATGASSTSPRSPARRAIPTRPPTARPRAASSPSPRASARRLAGSGVLANCVAPAAVETRIFDQMTRTHIDSMLSKIPLGRFGLPRGDRRPGGLALLRGVLVLDRRRVRPLRRPRDLLTGPAAAPTLAAPSQPPHPTTRGRP